MLYPLIWDVVDGGLCGLTVYLLASMLDVSLINEFVPKLVEKLYPKQVIDHRIDEGRFTGTGHTDNYEIVASMTRLSARTMTF